MLSYEDLYGGQPFRNEAHLATIIGPTVNPHYPSKELHQYGAFIPREEKHIHPVGSNADIVLANPKKFAEELLFMGCNMIHGQGDTPLLLFDEQESEILKQLGLICVQSYNFFILVSDFATIDAVLSNPMNRKLVARLSYSPLEIVMSYTPQPVFLQTPDRFQQLYTFIGTRIIDYFAQSQRQEIYVRLLQHILKHEFEHLKGHLQCGFIVVFDRMSEYLQLLLSVAQLTDPTLTELKNGVDAALDTFPNFVEFSLYAKQSYHVYLESTAILTEFLTNPDSGEYQLQPLSVLIRIALFLHSVCSMLEPSSSSQSFSEHDHAMMNILFGKLLTVNECEEYLLTDQMIERIDQILSNPAQFLNQRVWQALYTQFTQAAIEISQSVTKTLDALDIALQPRGIKFIGHEVEYQGVRIQLPLEY